MESGFEGRSRILATQTGTTDIRRKTLWFAFFSARLSRRFLGELRRTGEPADMLALLHKPLGTWNRARTAKLCPIRHIHFIKDRLFC